LLLASFDHAAQETASNDISAKPGEMRKNLIVNSLQIQ
jgi:hypothetical protein